MSSHLQGPGGRGAPGVSRVFQGAQLSQHQAMWVQWSPDKWFPHTAGHTASVSLSFQIREIGPVISALWRLIGLSAQICITDMGWWGLGRGKGVQAGPVFYQASLHLSAFPPGALRVGALGSCRQQSLTQSLNPNSLQTGW